MERPYTPPKIDEGAFHCPFCHAYSSVLWGTLTAHIPTRIVGLSQKAALCNHCNKWSFWVPEEKGMGAKGPIILWRMVYPDLLIAPMPSNDIPANCLSDYMEARQVLPYSPRATASLLRLCIQKLCNELGEKGENINDDISSLVKKGLDARLQKALDIVRVTGNNAVHPGEMNIDDDPEVAERLFKLTNMIVEEMITKPAELDTLYEDLPEGALKAIEKRDK